MIKAIDALDKSVVSHDTDAPLYWETASKKIEAGIIKETAKGKTYLKIVLRAVYAQYCKDKLKEYGYKTEEINSSLESTQLIVSWGEEPK